MAEKKSRKSKVVTYLLGLLLLTGIAGEVFVLYAVDDPDWRVRLGLLCIAVIVWPLAMAAKRPALASTREPPVRHRGRFFLLRRRVEEFLREVTRLNWLVLDTKRNSGIARSRQDEIDTVKQDLRELLDEIFRAAGQPGAKPESDAPFKERFSSAFPAVGDFAPGMDLDLDVPQERRTP